MSFWKKLAKIATIALPIAAAPFTGGASLAAIGAGAGAANAALSGQGIKGALLGAGLGAIPGVAKAATAAHAGTAAATSIGGAVAPVTHGSTLANLLTAAPKLLSGVSSVVGAVDRAKTGGIDPNQAAIERGVVAGNMADQAANNRYRDAQTAQAGPAADAAALANVKRAGQLANYTPVSFYTQGLFDKYGKRAPTVDPNTIKYAGDFQAELMHRQAAGQAPTTFGVPGAGAQETADSAAARAAAERGYQVPAATTTQNYLSAGSEIAKMAPAFLDILNQFRGKPKPKDEV